ncbi:MAG: hypothetical protein D6701_03995, partial [Gemmatimonadetes bacterium]
MGVLDTRARRAAAALALVGLALGAGAAPLTAQVAQEAVDLEVVQRIREEGLEHSQIESLARHLTEVIGPRLTGSPAMKAANEWTAGRFRAWGLEGVQIEPWGEFGTGWELVSYAGMILTPYRQPLQGQPLAWSGSTQGRVRGPAVVVEATSPEDVARYRGKLAGAFVLVDPPAAVTPEFEHRPRRTPLEDLLEPPSDGGDRRPAMSPEERQRRIAQFRARRATAQAVAELARAEGAAAILRNSSRGDGVVS